MGGKMFQELRVHLYFVQGMKKIPQQNEHASKKGFHPGIINVPTELLLRIDIKESHVTF